MEKTAAVLLVGVLFAAATAGEPGELKPLPPCDGPDCAAPVRHAPQRATVVYVPPTQLSGTGLASASDMPLNMPRPPLPGVQIQDTTPKARVVKVAHQVPQDDYDPAGRPQRETVAPLPPSPHEEPSKVEAESSHSCQECEQHGDEDCNGRRHPVHRFKEYCREEAGCPCLFHEPPLGFNVRIALNAQIHNGLADQLVLYQYDFLPGDQGGELSARGRHQLEKFADLMLATGAGPLVIESSSPQLDEARRDEALVRLRALDASFTDASVVIGRPRAPGLRGDEARLIDLNNLLNTERRGRLLPKPDHGGLGGVETH